MPVMKSEDEIQLAHDMLWEVVFGNLSQYVSQADKISYLALLSGLCWILGHESGKDVDKWLGQIDRMAAYTGGAFLER